MKILYFTDTFHPMINGIVISIETFARELSLRGHEICIIVPKNKWVSDISIPGVEILTVQWFPALFYPDFKVTFAFTPSLLRKILKFKPDIIHFHTQFVLGWQAIILGKILKIPRIGTFHTFIADEWYLNILWMPDNKIFGEIGWTYNNLYYKTIEHVIVPSQNARVELSEHGIDIAKISVIPNPVPLRIHTHDTLSIQERFLDKITSENIILYVGRISYEKSLDICIDTIKEIKETILDIRFILVGDGPQKADIEEYVMNAGLSDNIIFLWSIAHEVLMNSDIFERSWLFLTASKSETQWLTLLEAMSFGLPVVGVDIRWVGEIIEDNGYKATPDNSHEMAEYCIRILRDSTLAQKLSERSLEIVKKYDIIPITTLLEKLYHRVITQWFWKRKIKHKS